MEQARRLTSVLFANLPVSFNPALTAIFSVFPALTGGLKERENVGVCVLRRVHVCELSVHSPRGVKHDKVRRSGHRLVEHLHRVRVLRVLVLLLFTKHAAQQQRQVN